MSSHRWFYHTKGHGPNALKAKTQNVRVWSKERFVNKEGTNREDGRLSGAPNPSYCRTRLRVYKGLGGTGMGQFTIGGPWRLAIYGKRASTPDFPGQQTFASDRSCPSPLLS